MLCVGVLALFPPAKGETAHEIKTKGGVVATLSICYLFLFPESKSFAATFIQKHYPTDIVIIMTTANPHLLLPDL